MSCVLCFQFSGYDLIFIPGDHTPEHFHLSKKGESWEVALEFQLCTEQLLETRSVRPATWKSTEQPLKGKQLKDLCKHIVDNRLALLEEWEKAHEGLEL